MKYWLIKTEPGNWSWTDQTTAKGKTTEWDGVRNYQANNNMKAMAKGDRCFFYHSVKEKTIVGVVEVTKAWELDPTDKTGKGFGMVTVKAIGEMPEPVTLGDIKGVDALSDMVLVNNSRLSVQPVTAKEWKAICKMGGFKN
ncbi:MAG: EVE domain-containing protein [Planctomycetota bacterium]